MDDLCKIGVLAFMTCILAAGCTGSSGSTTASKSGGAAGLEQASPAGPDGKMIFRQYCLTCHGSDGKLGLNGAKDLNLSTLTLEERIGIVTHGKNMMTPFKELLEPAEIEAVAKYTFTLGR
jgi:cytochrome c6